MQAQILAPAAVLVLWTIVILIWIIPTRFGAIARLEDKSLLSGKPGGRGVDLNGILPDKANWVAHNHDHLHEQPTLFYAVVVMLAIMGATGFDVLLAWVYVGFRILHSLWQIFVNKVPVRFLLFLISSLALMALAIRAAMVTVFADPSALPV